LINKTQYNLTRIKLVAAVNLHKGEISMEPAEGSHGTPAAVEKGKEGATCTETAKLEETGEESATCTDATELKEPAQEMMEEKMQTNDFFNICCGTFLSKLSNLFSRSWEEDDTSEYSL
jgi:hypothetical protein